ncbi:MAG: peptidoglycan-binding domain-containing protein [Rhodospirillales bacterium]
MRILLRPAPIPFPVLALSLSLVLACAQAWAPAALASTAPADPAADAVYERFLHDPVIERIQFRLRGMGFYRGPLDGRAGKALDEAVRMYQQAAGLKITGALSEELLEALDKNSQIQDLMGRLADSRRQSIEDARSALSNHPATRDLLRGDETFRADPTRDPNVCFDTPTARCLLLEAETAARTVYRRSLRDWALGEVLAAQARVGLSEAARRTASRISDPRLIMNALSDIAEALTGMGLYKSALEAASVIPEPENRADALMTVIDKLANTDEEDEDIRPTIAAAAAAETVIKRMTETLDLLATGPKAVGLRARLAAAMARLARAGEAQIQIAEAERTAREDLAQNQRDSALRAVAEALADMRQPERALALLAHTEDTDARAPVLMSAAAAQAQAGDAAAALATAGEINEVRYRTVVLARIAKAQFAMGDTESALATLELAGAAVETIRMPFARSYAMGRVAEALAKISHNAGEFDGAVLVAGRIDDSRLRAQALWAVARRQKERSVDSARTEALAEDAIQEVRSTLSRAWAYADLAEARAKRGDAEGAWAAFHSGLAEARVIKNDWRRARALARIAVTLVQVVDGAVDASLAPAPAPEPETAPDGG